TATGKRWPPPRKRIEPSMERAFDNVLGRRYSLAMAAYVPPGWPSGVHPPGSEDFERTAVAWLLDVVPADYRLYGVLRRYPLALGAMAVHHADACVAGARRADPPPRPQP